MVSFADEYDYLIHLVRCAIHDQTPSELPDGVIFDSVYNCGVAHSIANIAWYSLDKLGALPAAELYEKWSANKDHAIVRDMNQSFARDELTEAFEVANIPVTEVQGTKLKALYPRPEYRTMSDIDFIIPRKYLSEAERILTELGYSCRNTTGVEVDGFRRPNMIVEVHTEFFPKDSEYHGIMGDPFDFTDYDEMLYVYSILHTAKHYFREGCGIRRVLDVYLLNIHLPDIRKRAGVIDILAKAGVSEFAEDMSVLARCWFGDVPKEPPERLGEMISVIKESGTHGTETRRLTNRFAGEKNKGAKNIKARYVLHRIFPGMQVLRVNYPVLKRFPVLTPFCWFHRIFGAITRKRKRISREVKTVREIKIDK